MYYLCLHSHVKWKGLLPYNWLYVWALANTYCGRFMTISWEVTSEYKLRVKLFRNNY